MKTKPEDEETYWNREIRKARAKREYEEEQKKMKDLEAGPPESPIQIRGGINLGDFDLQEQNRLAQERSENERRLAQERADKLERERDEAKEKVYQTTLESLKSEFSEKLAQLQRAVDNGSTTSKNSVADFQKQYEDTLALAQKLGLEKTNTGTNPTAEVELKKLDWQIKREDREFQRQMKKDEREWQLRMEELKDERMKWQLQAQAQDKKDKMFAQFPNMIGGAIARGVIETGDSDEKKGVAAKGKAKVYTLEVDEGEAGEYPCPECNTPVGIGQTAKGAVCVNCGSRFNIKRTGTKEQYNEEEGIV